MQGRQQIQESSCYRCFLGRVRACQSLLGDDTHTHKLLQTYACMHVHVCLYNTYVAFVYTCVSVYIYLYIRMWVWIYACRYVLCMRERKRERERERECVCVCMYLRTYVCMLACTYVCTRTYVHTHTHTHTRTHTLIPGSRPIQGRACCLWRRCMCQKRPNTQAKETYYHCLSAKRDLIHRQKRPIIIASVSKET
jgi:hypothetical protein